MKKFSRSILLTLLILSLLILATPAFTAPQHWGFGFGYLVVLEQAPDGNKVLSVYEPPLRVKDCPWLLRWRDSSGQFNDVLKNGIAVGDFFPEPIGREYLVALTGTDENRLKGKIYETPEVFSTRPWKSIGDFSLPESKLFFVGITAGRFFGSKTDCIVTLHNPTWIVTTYTIKVYSPPENSDTGEWRLIHTAKLDPDVYTSEKISGIASIRMHDTKGEDTIALLGKEIIYINLVDPSTASGDYTGYKEIARDKGFTPGKTSGIFTAHDFLKDGFGYLAVSNDDGNILFRTSPGTVDSFNTIRARKYETFAGAKLENHQPDSGSLIMTGTLDNPAGTPLASAAGRIFGYIIPGCDERKEKIWKPWTYQGFDDVEISFARRTPVYRLGVPKRWQDGNWPWEPDDHYGWPHKDEEVTYEVHIKNNGREVIPAGKITLNAWVDTPDRNADTKPDYAKTMNFSAVIDKPLPPFDPAKPEYHIVKITFPWPYNLVQPEGWTWKKINVAEIGERWLIMRLEYEGDENERNDRYEMALNALLLRPVYRFDEGENTLTFRAPTTTGDPESKEYITRKLADAVQCMWERSRTSSGEDVLQRVAFVGYRPGQGISSDRALDWSFYEGPRDLDRWIGLWGDYERSDPWDGGAELHETGHLFHRIGDLYHYYVMPSYTRHIKMADGSPVQIYTYAWGRDSYCDGQAIIGEGGSDLHKYLEGVRYGLGFPWHRMLPEKVYVRILDSDGNPVDGAKVTWWYCSPTEQREEGQGVTGSDGRWLSNMTKGDRYIFDPFNIPLRDGRAYDALAHLFTVDINGYTDFMVLGAEDVSAHSRYTLMQKSITDREEWTWDFNTLYKPGAPKPDFEVICGVQGRHITLTVSSEPGKTYRLYRRWEPAYTYNMIAEKKAVSDTTAFTDNMGARDWFGENRFRAAYYVTEIDDGVESLPVRVYGIATDKVYGVTYMGEGRLLVALNCGKAEPFGAIFHGTTPAEEYIKHFRFGHTALKIVPSKTGLERHYAVLTGADMGFFDGSEHKFDLIQFDKPDRFQGHYPVLHAISHHRVRSFSSESPYTIEIENDSHASCPPNIGDIVADGDNRARITSISGNTLHLSKPVLSRRHGDHHVQILHYPGEEGDGTVNRQLRNPRGLDVISHGGKEYVAIADYGNNRVVVWDSTTKFINRFTMPGFLPSAIASIPGENSNRFVVLSRNRNRESYLMVLEFDGENIRAVTEAVSVDAGDSIDGIETGLAVAPVMKDGKYLIAVTDASMKRVVEYTLSGNKLEQVAEYKEATGSFAGEKTLINPTDCAYSESNRQLHLYVADGGERIVQVK